MKKLTSSALALAIGFAAPALAVAAPSQHPASGSSVPKITKTQAIQEMRTDGYTNIQDVRAVKTGWTAKAKESGKPVSLSVDSTMGVRKQ